MEHQTGQTEEKQLCDCEDGRQTGEFPHTSGRVSTADSWQFGEEHFRSI